MIKIHTHARTQKEMKFFNNHQYIINNATNNIFLFQLLQINKIQNEIKNFFFHLEYINLNILLTSIVDQFITHNL